MRYSIYFAVIFQTIFLLTACNPTLTGHNNPIEYYGKIIDQYGSPVSDVTVTVSIGRWGLVGPYPESKVITKTTDKEGRFSIEGEAGLGLGFKKISKIGYDFQYVNSINFRGGSRKQSKPKHVNVIHAYKITKVPNLLLVGRARFDGLITDGRAYSFDLLNKKMKEGNTLGQIRIAYTRKKEAKRNSPSDWAVSVEAIQGGLIQTTDIFMIDAPDVGYTPKWSESFKFGSPDWKEQIKRKFYLRTNDGKVHARLEIEFFPFYGTSNSTNRIDVDYWINNEGTRALYSSKKYY